MMHVYADNSPTFNGLTSKEQWIIYSICKELCCTLEFAAECYLMFDKNLAATERYIRKELMGAKYNRFKYTKGEMA